jgi:outer membrane protein OmpA-like peptidoglycan-associated protein
VKQALVGQGVAAARVTDEGFGSERPIASNDTENGRAKNRRVELVVVKR